MNKKMAGFSLLEASITMLIVGIFTALCANAYTKRHVTYQESDGHGRYECYRVGNTITQRYVENNSPRVVNNPTCVFRPPRYAKYFLFAVSGGGTSSAAGKFDTLFYTSLTDPITITPGTAGGGNTTLMMKGATIHTTRGGGGQVVVTSSTAETIDACTITPTAGYDCGNTPSCSQSGTDVIVKYCAGSDAASFTTTTLKLDDVKANRFSYSGDTVTYRDLSSYTNRGYLASDAAQHMRTCTEESCLPVAYSMDLKFRMQNEQQSQMENYLIALGIKDGIAAQRPGALSRAGAVLILW